MAVLEQLEPRIVFHFFEEICKIPRGTFYTKEISDYCVAFAKERGLEYIQDHVNNIIIKKPGTAGYENSAPVILQGHLDMVCEKRPESAHDFKKEGIELLVEDGFIKAKDTTLGGDDGIAVAMALAILDSADIAHPPLEAVFTVDEEIGMGGASEIDLSVLEGRKLINIDSEEEGILTTGCAGGFTCAVHIPIKKESNKGTVLELRLHGLLGGHSGVEIHKQRGNAHKEMGRLLKSILTDIPVHLISVAGGTKDNVIAMESTAKILVPDSDVDAVTEKVSKMKDVWKDEFMGEEPGLTLDINPGESGDITGMDADSTKRVVDFLIICPDGVQGFVRKLEHFVETSLNMGIVETHEDEVKTVSLVRSSVESKKQQLMEQLIVCAEAAGGEARIGSSYPAWKYNPESELLKIMETTYEDLFGSKPEVSAIHAGLECGLFIGKCPDLDCVSFGPDILDVHSFHERLDIASTERMWAYLKEILARLK